MSARVHNGFLSSVLSFNDDYSNNKANYLLVVDITARKIVFIEQNPIFKSYPYPLKDYFNDTLFLLSPQENLQYTFDGKLWQKKYVELKSAWHFASVTKTSNAAILSGSVYGITLLDNNGNELDKIYNNPVLPGYFSDFSQPIDSSLFLYGAKRAGEDSVDFFSTNGWKLRLKRGTSEDDDNFHIYLFRKKYIIILNSRLLVLETESGNKLFEADLGKGKIAAHRMERDMIYLTCYDGQFCWLYNFNLNRDEVEFVGKGGPTVFQFVKKDSTYYSFEADGVYQLNSKDTGNNEIRKDLENIAGSTSITDVTNGRNYFLKGTTLMW